MFPFPKQIGHSDVSYTDSILYKGLFVFGTLSESRVTISGTRYGIMLETRYPKEIEKI